MDISNLAEGLQILTLYGKSILESLSRVKCISVMPGKSTPTATPFLRFFKDTNLLTLAQTFVKKFPDYDSVNKQTKEYKEFIDAFKELKEELRPIYQVFILWAEFIDHALAALTCCTHLTHLDMDVNPLLAYPFVLLGHQVFASFYLVAKMRKSKKAIAAAIAVIESRSGNPQENFTKISNLFNLSDNLHSAMINMANPFSEHLHRTIMLLKPKLEAITFASASTLRHNSMLEVIDCGTFDLNSISIQLMPVFYLGQSSLLSNCMISLLLSRPASLLNDSHLCQFCKLVQTNGTFTHIATFDTFVPQPEFEGAMKVSSKYSKLKHVLCENSTKQKHMQLQFHDDRRQFLIERLTHLLLLCEDQPKMIALNTVPILTCLHLARDEVIWHLMHPEDDRKSAQKAFSKSLEILQLINIICEFKTLLIKYSDQVTTFFFHRIQSDWVQSFDQAYSALINLPDLPSCIKEILHDLQNAFQQFSRKNLAAFQQFRLDWARLQVYFCLPESVLPVSSMNHITATMNKLCILTMNIDRYQMHIDQATDLTLIFNYRETWFDMVLGAISKAQGLLYLKSVPFLLSTFSSLPVDFSDGRFMNLITDFLDKFFTSISQLVAKNLIKIIDQRIQLDRKIVTSSEGFSSVTSASRVKRLEDSFKSTGPVAHIDALRSRTFQCLSIFHEFPTVEGPRFSFNSLLCLESQLVSMLQYFLNNFIYDFYIMNSKDAPLLEDAAYFIVKPSLLLRDLQTMFEEILVLQWAFSEFSFLTVLEDVLMQQNTVQNINNFPDTVSDIISSRTSPTKKKVAKPPIQKPPYSVGLGNYYVDVFLHRAMFNKFLISPHMLTLRSDCDSYELSALMKLLGPTGVHFLDSKLLKHVSALGSFLISQFNNYATLFSNSPDSFTAVSSHFVKIKNLEEIFQKTAAFGALCDIRALYFKFFHRNFRLLTVLQIFSATQRKCLVFGSKVSQEDAILHNLNSKAQFLGLNEGIDISIIQNSSFITHVSNAHCIVSAIHSILTKSLSKFPDCNKKQCGILEEGTFATASNWALQFLVLRSSGKENPAQYYESAWMILKKFASEVGKPGLEWTESYIGTGLMYTIHASLLRKKGSQNKKANSEYESKLIEEGIE